MSRSTRELLLVDSPALEFIQEFTLFLAFPHNWNCPQQNTGQSPVSCRGQFLRGSFCLWLDQDIQREVLENYCLKYSLFLWVGHSCSGVDLVLKKFGISTGQAPSFSCLRTKCCWGQLLGDPDSSARVPSTSEKCHFCQFCLSCPLSSYFLSCILLPLIWNFTGARHCSENEKATSVF